MYINIVIICNNNIFIDRFIMYMDRSVCHQERHGYEYVLHTELPLPDREAHYSKMLVIHQAFGKMVSIFLSSVGRCHDVVIFFLLVGMVLPHRPSCQWRALTGFSSLIVMPSSLTRRRA